MLFECVEIREDVDVATRKAERYTETLGRQVAPGGVEAWERAGIAR